MYVLIFYLRAFCQSLKPATSAVHVSPQPLPRSADESQRGADSNHRLQVTKILQFRHLSEVFKENHK